MTVGGVRSAPVAMPAGIAIARASAATAVMTTMRRSDRLGSSESSCVQPAGARPHRPWDEGTSGGYPFGPLATARLGER